MPEKRADAGSPLTNKLILEYKPTTRGLGERQSIQQIYSRDLQKLDPEQYLNDSIIQFYLK